MQVMKEWKNMIFLVIVYGSCISNNIIVRKIQAVVNSVMKLGAPQNVGNFFTHWGIISSQEGVTIVSCNTKQMQSTTMKLWHRGDQMPGEFYRPTTLFSVLQVFAVALQKSYRSQVGLHCTIIRLCWQYPLKLAVCQMYIHYTHSGRGPQIFRISNSCLQTLGARSMTWSKFHTEHPQLWSDQLHSLLFGTSHHACELNAFLYIRDKTAIIMPKISGATIQNWVVCPLPGAWDVWTPAFWYEQLNIWLPYLCFAIHNSPPMPPSILETNTEEFLVFLISTIIGYKGNELCTIHHKINIKEKLWILNINLRWF